MIHATLLQFHQCPLYTSVPFIYNIVTIQFLQIAPFLPPLVVILWAPSFTPEVELPVRTYPFVNHVIMLLPPSGCCASLFPASSPHPNLHASPLQLHTFCYILYTCPLVTVLSHAKKLLCHTYTSALSSYTFAIHSMSPFCSFPFFTSATPSTLLTCQIATPPSEARDIIQ